MAEPIILKNALICDIEKNQLINKSILIENGIIKEIKNEINMPEVNTIDLKKKIVSPGFIDLHANILTSLNDVNNAIDISSKVALKGGYTTLCAMSNTNPPLDNEGMIGIIKHISSLKGGAEIIPVACATKGLQGKLMTEIGMLINAGAGLIYDTGQTIQDVDLLKSIMEYSKMFNVPLCLYAEDKYLAKNGLINESEVSTRLGLPGIPEIAENTIVARNISLAKYLKAKIHIAIVSTKESVDLIKTAKSQGVKITCGTTPHHIALNETDIKDFNTSYKIRPPLRSINDQNAMIEGIKDGTIDIIVTDHTPCSNHSKNKEFATAPFGIIGLETAFNVLYEKLVKTDEITLPELISKMSTAPANILGINKGKIEIGSPADLTIIELDCKNVILKESLVCQSKNSPFIDESYSSKITATIKNGIFKYKSE